MTTNEHLAAAKANLAPALKGARRSPECSALLNVISALDKLEDDVKALKAPKAKAAAKAPKAKAK
jgi:hypothetical protein